MLPDFTREDYGAYEVTDAEGEIVFRGKVYRTIYRNLISPTVYEYDPPFFAIEEYTVRCFEAVRLEER